MTTAESIAPDIALPPRYQIRSVLKQTPDTCVFRVFDAPDRRDEAIKILSREVTDPQQLLRFKTEFSTLASLEHASVIKVYDYGVLQDRYPYFTMEFFAGKRITEFFDGKNWDALYDVILQIASGLHHIHHLSARIPNYELQRCHDENPEFQAVNTITLFTSLKCITSASSISI